MIWVAFKINLLRFGSVAPKKHCSVVKDKLTRLGGISIRQNIIDKIMEANNIKLAILKEALEYDILASDSVLLDKLMATKREQIRGQHSYAITPPANDSGRWQTCYREDGKRKNIKAQTEEELLDKLIPIYFSNSHIDKLTFYELYLEWLEYKKSVTNSKNTI